MKGGERGGGKGGKGRERRVKERRRERREKEKRGEEFSNKDQIFGRWEGHLLYSFSFFLCQ
jgi:hypothetical protein